MGGIQLEFATVESTATVPGRLRQAEAGVLTREIKVLWQPSDIAILPRPGIARTMMSGNEGVARDKATKEKREKVRDTIILVVRWLVRRRKLATVAQNLWRLLCFARHQLGGAFSTVPMIGIPLEVFKNTRTTVQWR